MRGDQLSEVFDLVEVRAEMSGAFAVRGHWVARSQLSRPLKLIAMVRGQGRLLTDNSDSVILLEPGDIAILTNRSWLRLEGGPEREPAVEIFPEVQPLAASLIDAEPDSDVVVGGNVDVNAAGRALFVQALPPVARVTAAAASVTSLGQIFDKLIAEATSPQMGSAFAIRQYGQLLLLEVLRGYLRQADLPPGWLRLLADPRLRPAVDLMHAEPGKAWQLPELARSVAMSRSSFAERFRDVAGVPPLTYLSAWRMLLARRALRFRDVSVATLAAELGYTSENAFSTAFKRAVGVSPLRYRQQERSATRALWGLEPGRCSLGASRPDCRHPAEDIEEQHGRI